MGTKYLRPACLEAATFFLTIFWGVTEMKVLVNSVSGEDLSHIDGIFSLCPQMVKGNNLIPGADFYKDTCLRSS